MTAKEQRDELVKLAKSREKKNTYSQARPGNFWGKNGGKGSSDCSDTWAQLYKRVLGISIGSNTSEQLSNAVKGKNGAIIVDRPSGNQFDQSKLQVGDLLYFKGNTNNYQSVGHVEGYVAKNTCFGHGSGTGGTVKNLKDYCASRTGSRKALAAVRFIKDDVKPLVWGEDEIRKGMIDPIVKTLQLLLLDWGYSLGSFGADSDFGGKTFEAVVAWQTDNNLKPDGVIKDVDYDVIDALLSPTDPESGDPPEDPSPEPMPLPKPEYGDQFVTVTNGETVYIRSQPTTDAPVCSVAKLGDKFPYAGETSTSGWHSIVVGDRDMAWISGKYTTLSEPIEPEPVPPTPPSPQTPHSKYLTDEQWARLNSTDICADISHHDPVLKGHNYVAPMIWIRSGDSTNVLDKNMKQNIAQAVEFRIPFATYMFSRASTEKAMKAEIDQWVKHVRSTGHEPNLGWWLDIEVDASNNPTLRYGIEYLKTLIPNDQIFGIYIANRLFKKFEGLLHRWDVIWVPRYSGKKPDSDRYDIHQFGFAAFPGINGKNKTVDANRPHVGMTWQDVFQKRT